MRAVSMMALAALLAAACSDSTSEPADKPWTSSSQRISIQSFGPFRGLSGYERQRAELTAEQLALLDALEVFEPLDSCGTDQLGYSITIVDAAGGSHAYHATQWDQACDVTDPFLSMASLKPFLATFSCVESRFAGEQPAIRPGDGCRHGLYMDGQGTGVRAELQIAAAGEVTLATEASTAFAPQLKLLDVDGTTVLRSGGASLTYAFAAAGTYFVEVSSSTATHGDLLLRVD